MIFIQTRCMFWNINGMRESLISDFMINWLYINGDILFISETHLCKGQKFKLRNFVGFHSNFSEPGTKHPRGGGGSIMLYNATTDPPH